MMGVSSLQRRATSRFLLAALLLLLLTPRNGHAQQITGTPGSPNATTTMLDPPKLTAEDEKKLMDGARLARDAK
jgi:hypothetical protein